jgi:hypothetical protein
MAAAEDRKTGVRGAPQLELRSGRAFPFRREEPMSNFWLRGVAVCAILTAALLASPVHAQDQAAPPLVEQINNGNWLPKAEAESLVDDLYYQQAVQAYITMLPALNVIGMRDGSEAPFGSGYNVLPIWKERMDSRTWVPTPNADVIYSMSYLDLKETGPLVVAAPPNVIGMFTDFFQGTITDVGAIGPDRARGGLYLLLPPGYKGEIPKGYFAFESKTYNVFLFFRTIMKKGENGPDPAPPVTLAEQTRIYPLWTMEKDVKPMIFPDGSGKPINMMYPTDNSYWTKLKAFVDYEPDAAIEPMLRGTLAAIGIVKGQPFAPTDKQQQLLKKAVETAPKMILATRQLRLPPDPPAALFWAVTAYNITDGTMTAAPQLMPSINGFNKVATNADGSIDLYFGAQKPPNTADSNWIQTVDGRDFLVALRLYGGGGAFYDQTWKPDDVVKAK